MQSSEHRLRVLGLWLPDPRAQPRQRAHGLSGSKGSLQIQSLIPHCPALAGGSLPLSRREPWELTSKELLKARSPGRPCVWLRGLGACWEGPTRRSSSWVYFHSSDLPAEPTTCFRPQTLLPLSGVTLAC